MSKDISETEKLEREKKIWSLIGELLMITNTGLGLAVIFLLWLMEGG